MPDGKAMEEDLLEVRTSKNTLDVEEAQNDKLALNLTREEQEWCTCHMDQIQCLEMGADDIAEEKYRVLREACE